VVRQARIGSAPDHLRDWVVGRAKGMDLGDVRYARVAWLYLYYELALLRRYRAACLANVERLDEALAGVMGRTSDTVKKLRRELHRART
jgi:hypothetical protein